MLIYQWPGPERGMGNALVIERKFIGEPDGPYADEEYYSCRMARERVRNVYRALRRRDMPPYAARMVVWDMLFVAYMVQGVNPIRFTDGAQMARDRFAKEMAATC